IERRHTTRRPPLAAGEVEGPAHALPDDPRAETETNGGDGGIEQLFEHLAGDVPLSELEPQLEEHWARLAAAESNVVAREARIVELEAELTALRRRLDESQAAAEAERADTGNLAELERSLAAARREADERARRLEEASGERDEARRAL